MNKYLGGVGFTKTYEGEFTQIKISNKIRKSVYNRSMRHYPHRNYFNKEGNDNGELFIVDHGKEISISNLYTDDSVFYKSIQGRRGVDGWRSEVYLFADITYEDGHLERCYYRFNWDYQRHKDRIVNQ